MTRDERRQATADASDEFNGTMTLSGMLLELQARGLRVELGNCLNGEWWAMTRFTASAGRSHVYHGRTPFAAVVQVYCD